MAISKKNMGAKAEKAAQQAPSFVDRLSIVENAIHPNQDETNTRPVETPQVKELVTAPTSQVLSKSVVGLEEFVTSSGARVLEVPINLIDLNPFNARQIYKPERVAELAKSIAANGQEIPGIATLKKGRYVLVAGHYRLRAIKQLGLEKMLVLVHNNLSDRDLYAMSYRENAERESQTTLDNAMSWRTLLDQGVYKRETEIAEATGLSLPNINKTMAVLKLSKETLDVIQQEPANFALSSLYELVQFEAVAGVASGVKMAKLILEGEVGRADINEARAKLQEGKERKRKETSRQYIVQASGKKIGKLKEWDSGKVALELVFDEPEKRIKFVNMLKEQLEIAQ